jgi:putative component of membrane protein insertase Oxa1/YidC/SpoIIIJ protein YidD
VRGLIVATALGAAGCHAPPRVGAACAAPPAFAPFDAPRPPAAPAAPSHGVLDALLAWYQDHGRAQVLPGAGCPFTPTCSVYARRAVRRHGALGLVLILDRLLVREHVLAPAYYPIACVGHTTRLVDDVP